MSLMNKVRQRAIVRHVAGRRDFQRLLPPRVRPGVVSRLVDTGGHPQWAREVMTADTRRELDALRPETTNVAEISSDATASWRDLPWKSYTPLDFPDFDLVAPPDPLPGPFDLVLCEQVLEHVVDPLKAVDTLARLCAADGHLFVSTPFLIRLHNHPGDFWRFTPAGLELLLRSRGLEPLWVRSWGNRHAIAANFDHWTARLPGQSLRNEANLPMVVWSMSRPRG
jgi:SAM-dependent methyltransferase